MVGHESQSGGGKTGLKIVPLEEMPAAQPTPIEEPMELYKLAQKMKTLCVQHGGKGLSAVQVGIPWDLFVVRDLPKDLCLSDKWGIFLRCRYEPQSDKTHESIEGCLSIKRPDGGIRLYVVNRWMQVRVVGYRLVDSPELVVEKFDKFLDLKSDGVVFQHEIDHASGILVSQLGEEIFLWE